MKSSLFKLAFILVFSFLARAGICQIYPFPNYTLGAFDYGFHQHMFYLRLQDDVGGNKMSRLVKKEALDSARANIKLLKQNTLVVRLKTGSSKIKALKRRINSPSITEKHRERYQRMLDKTIAEIHEENLSLMEAFKEKYTFSNVLFMPDTLAQQLKRGKRQGIFLNESMELDSSLSFKSYYFLAYYGESDADDHSSVEGLNIVDQNFQPLKYPFPSFIGRAWIWRGLREFFFMANDVEHYGKLVEKFNKTMEIN